MARSRSPSPAPRPWTEHLKSGAVLGALAALFEDMSAQTAVASVMVTIGAPLAATAFVYEVSNLRDAQLVHEAVDRHEYWTGKATPTPASPDAIIEKVAVEPQRPVTVANKLDAMLASRATILDTFGDEPSTVAPIYVRIIKQMIEDDDRTFASMSEKRPFDGVEDATDMAAKEASLRAAHARLVHLAGS
jgi:hypothetical protein